MSKFKELSITELYKTSGGNFLVDLMVIHGEIRRVTGTTLLLLVFLPLLHKSLETVGEVLVHQEWANVNV